MYTSLSKLSKCIVKDYDCKDVRIFKCNKIKIITIYDIYKNKIYEPIQIKLFERIIKIGTILEDYDNIIVK